MRPLASWLLPLLALAACEPLATVPKDGGMGGGGAGGSTSTGGRGGAGGVGIECLLPIDCAGEDTECRKRTCVDFVCGHEDAPEGTESAAQVAGDCLKRVCDGAGHSTQIADSLDILDDHNACTVDLCAGGQPRNEPWITSSCGLEGEGVCDGHGNCAGCVTAAQCNDGMSCVNNRCLPPSCLDGQRNDDETAIDCGGPVCGPCGAGKACRRDRDCASAVCDAAGKLCVAAKCDDGKRNGGETGVDCGGPCALRCAAGAGCAQDSDCLGGNCSGAICLPSCVDGVKNGAETGLDCGGHACVPCPVGAGCGVGDDCTSGVCQAARCVPVACVDGVKGEGETDLDCGGSCAPCKPGKACATGDDCESTICAGTICATPSCADHARNAGETGIDCGGPKCGACPDGQGCATAADCESHVCASGVCVSPGCTDGVKNLAETDVDCGGPACPSCGPTLACVVDTDCASTKCAAGKCTGSKCDDGIQNGDETAVDCGGSCAPCALTQGCLVHEDCDTIACAGGVCVPPSCTDHVRNADETGTDCGGPLCGKCPGGQGCTSAVDCASGTCTGGVCEASCTNAVQDGDETGVDCGGSCDGCLPGGPCDVDGDCASDVCVGGTCLAPTCQDGVKNGDESDADCGGGTCGPCGVGKHCDVNSDCVTLGCRKELCEEVLLFSEVRSNGPNTMSPADDSFADEIVELYNPGNAPIVMDATWQLNHRSAQGACQGLFLRYKGTGLTIPPHHHLLLTGLAYAGPPGDAPLISTPGNSIADSASLWLDHGGKVIDAMCYYSDPMALDRLIGLGGCVPYICEGPPANNFPHDGTKGSNSSVDVSLERRPGGALGNGQDTDNTTVDFKTIAPATPQSLSSPPTPP